MSDNKKIKAPIMIEASTIDKCSMIANLTQHMVKIVPEDDLIKLLDKVRENPSLVQKALKWI